MGIECRRKENKIIGFSDDDFAGDLGDQKSKTRFFVETGRWGYKRAAKKKRIVALSTLEAEYVA